MNEELEPLEKPEDVTKGEWYCILSGDGEGECGYCVETTRTDFGHAWGLVSVNSGNYWTRWHMLARVK